MKTCQMSDMIIDSFSVGNYLVDRMEIGKGSFSTIYKGVNKMDKKTYALKQISFNETTKVKMKSYIEKEINIMKKIRHVNIVMLHDTVIDTVNGYIYLILEYCERGDFYKFQNHKPISEMYVQKFMKQLIDALQYLHDIHNIVHRDLKPQNLLMGNDGNIKLTDFGFAKNDVNPLTSTICGSPLYMAPEIINGHGNKYSAEKSDLWSVGIIMYEMLVGHTPYIGRHYFELQSNLKNDIVLPLNVVVSNDCSNLLYSLLQRNPTKRITWDNLFEHPWLKSNLLEESENRLLAFDINDDAKLPSIEDFEKDRKMFESIELTKSEKHRFNENSDTDNEMFYSIDSVYSNKSNDKNNILNELKDALEPDLNEPQFTKGSKLHTRLNTQPLREKSDDYSFDLVFEQDYFDTNKSISTSLTIDEISTSQLNTSQISGKFTFVHSPPNRVTKSDTSYNRTNPLTKLAKSSWNVLKNSIEYVNTYGKSV